MVSVHGGDSRHDDNEMIIDYPNSLNFSFTSEFIVKKYASVWEFSFGRFKLDSVTNDYYYDLSEDMSSKADNLWNFAWTYYGGHVFHQYHRWQFPVYAGVGCQYLNGGLIHNFIPHVALKLRIKCYITNELGIFMGANGYIGLYGLKDYQDIEFRLNNGRAFLDFGIVYSFKDK